MGNKKLNIKNNISLKDYQKKHKNFSYKLMSFTEKEVNEFDKANGRTDKSLLKGKKWCKIDGKYYQLPKASVFNWFRNLNAAGKSAVCLLTCGVVAGATATPFIINSLNNSKVTIKVGKGLSDVKQIKDPQTGSIVITVTPTIETEGINKDEESVKVSYKKGDVETVLEEDQYDIEEDTKVIIAEEVQKEHLGEELIVTLNSTVTDTPDQYEITEEENPETHEMETIAEVDDETAVEEPGEELAIPSREKKSGKKKKIDKVRVKASDRRKEKTKKLTLSDDIKNVESSNQDEGPFEGFINLLKARIPDNLEKLVKYFFRNCEKLKELKGAKNTKELGEMCLTNCYNLEKFVAKNVKTLGLGCFALIEDLLPEGKKNVVSKLKEVILSDKIETFPGGAFFNNANLRKVKGGKNAKEVEDSCYMNCFSLKELDILMSETLTKIGNDAFRNTAIEKMLIGKNIVIDHETGGYSNSFKNDGMLKTLYVENSIFANLDRSSHDKHGALDNANKVFVKKDIKLAQTSGIRDRFEKNEEESKKNDKYDVYDAPSTGDKKHQIYQHSNIFEGEPNTIGYRYTGKDEEMKMPTLEKQPLLANVTHINSHGFRNNKDTKKVDLRIYDEQQRHIESITHIGTDKDNGYSFQGCDLLEFIEGIQKVIQICAYSFMGTALREFTMPAGISRENLGKGAFNDHKTKQMTLTLQKRGSAEEPVAEEDQLYNNEDDDSGMYDASETVYVPEDADVKENSYLKKNYEKQTTTTGQKQKWVKKQK